MPISPDQRLDSEGLLDNRGVEGDLPDCSDLTVDQMRGFGDHQLGGDQWAIIGFEQVTAGVIVGVIAIGAATSTPVSTINTPRVARSLR